MTTVKETLEASESAVSQGNSRSGGESGHLRSDAVSLDVPVRVHGSRLVDAVRGALPHTEAFEENTTTMIVFPQGGVLRMSTSLSVGQAVILTNLKSKQDAICRVVKVRANPHLHSYVEIEFTHAQPGYWGVYFPSDAPTQAKKSVPHVPPSVAAPVTPVAPAGVVQRAEKPVPVAVSPSAASLSLAELRGDTAPVPAKLAPTEDVTDELRAASGRAAEEAPAPRKESRTPVRLAVVSSNSTPQAASREFGSRLNYGGLETKDESGDAPRSESGSPLLKIAVAVLLLAGVAGGAYYFYSHVQVVARPVTSAPAAPELPLAPAEAENAVPSPPAIRSANPRPNQPLPTPVPGLRIESAAVPSKPEKSPDAESKSAASKKEQPAHAPSPVPDMFGAMNAHPVASGRGSDISSESAPSVDTNPTNSGGNALAAVTAPAINIAPPIAEGSQAPVPVGGAIKVPRAISSPPAVYPSIAESANVQGDVVLRVVIDKAGKVTEAHVISGPLLLRSAAVDALRQRKYEPTKLNGQPISVEMLVTMQFRR